MRFCAIGEPIIPRPRNPSRAGLSSAANMLKLGRKECDSILESDSRTHNTIGQYLIQKLDTATFTLVAKFSSNYLPITFATPKSPKKNNTIVAYIKTVTSLGGI